MKNYVQQGDVITVAAPRALASGDGVLVGALFGVAGHSAANGAEVEILTRGVVTLPALATDVVAMGARVYWDNANNRVTGTVGANTLIGCAVAAKANGVSSITVRLNGVA